ncbi:hypothetical protein M422DRAFT_185414, partial [Sphaerobolus stellatus SS14]
APLASCTVEMLSLFKHHEVVVIDEIQMIADAHRGGAWTAAVLGARTDELHLCGEEAAVPLVQKMLAETGDEIIINRYERLTPLTVAKNGLHGNWSLIERGDCIVTFSRNGIFRLKAQVEAQTGLRCAVVYGRLPPETRSDQASLFNVKDSGYDVLIATDAIGMGLNLKIKRVVFSELIKHDGTKLAALSLSQVKQIGGRAGRFGEHAEGTNGVVTCFHDKDIPVLREGFALDAPSLLKATLPLSLADFSRMAQLLPQNLRVSDLFTLLHLGARLGEAYSLPALEGSLRGMEVIDAIGHGMTLREKLQFCNCPVAWRKEAEVEIMTSFIRRYMAGEIVDIEECFNERELLSILKSTSAERISGVGTRTDAQQKDLLGKMETCHRVLLAYIWLAYRNPVSFTQMTEAIALKEETESNIDYILSSIQDPILAEQPAPKTAAQLREEGQSLPLEYELRLQKAPNFRELAATA